MSEIVLLANIERLLKAKRMSADAVSKAAGVPDAIRNLRRRVAGDKQGTWKLDTLTAIAEALETSPWELLRPPGALPEGEEFREYILDIVDERLANA